jgi:hypothetical protein
MSSSVPRPAAARAWVMRSVSRWMASACSATSRAHLRSHGGVRSRYAGFAGAHARSSTFATAAHTAKKVNLPMGHEAGVEAAACAFFTAGAWPLRQRLYGPADTAAEASARVAGGIDLDEAGTGFFQSRLGDTDIAVGCQGALHQDAELHVVEAAPKGGDVGRHRVAVGLIVAGLNEGGVQHGCGALVVGAHGGAASQRHRRSQHKARRGQPKELAWFSHADLLQRECCAAVRLRSAGGLFVNAAGHRTRE